MEDHILFHREDVVLDLLDQRKLPGVEERFLCRTTADVITALQVMVVRGAPAIGVSAAFGCAIALRESMGGSGWKEKLAGHLADLRAARPTAVNLAWAVDRMKALWEKNAALAPGDLMNVFIDEAERMRRADIESCMAIGRYGLPCVHDNDTILTHCNAGALATAGYGTALGVVRAAFENRKGIRVIADETRPFLQGARLTAWELQRDGIPVTVACDNACASLMSRGFVQCCVVGADRIAANGDTANKIGTYGVALLARHFGIPFYVAAPLSTIDSATPDGRHIPIEERPASEVTTIGTTQVTPTGVPVYNFAFDVTPAELITGIITDKGLLTAPYGDAIRDIFAREGL